MTCRSTVTRANEPKAAQLGVFWFGIQAVWGALLGVSLQARVSELAPHSALRSYALLAALGATTAAVTQICVGVLSDRRRAQGSRRVEFYLTGAVAAAAALFWFYAASSFTQLLAALLAVQLAMNVAIGPYQAVIPDFIPSQETGTAASWMAALQSIGNAAGALAAGLLANARMVWGVLAVGLLLSCAGTVRHVRRLRLSPVKSESPVFSRAFADLFISRALVYVGFYTLLGYLYFYIAVTIGADTKTATGIVLLIFTAAGAIGALVSGAPTNRIDRRWIAAIGGMGFIAALSAFLFAHTFLAIAASAVVAGIAWGVFLTADWALGCQMLPRGALATAMGIWNLALLVPQILAPLIATAVLSALGALQGGRGPRLAFVLAALEVFAGIAWIRRLPASPINLAQGGNKP